MQQDIIQSLEWRYATKKFDNTKVVPAQKIEVLKQAFNLTATSYGLQLLRLVVVSDPKLKEALVPASMNQQQVKDASHVLVICMENKFDEAYIKGHFDRVEAIRQTPREVLDPFHNYMVEVFKDKSWDEVSNWMSKQAYIALGNLLTVCAVEGIDSCPMEGFQPSEYDRILELDQHGLQSVLVLPVGYRSQEDIMAAMKKVRRGVSDVVIEL